MSEQKPKDIEFMYGSTKGRIRVNKIEKIDDFNFERMKMKILNFTGGTSSDNIRLKTSRLLRILWCLEDVVRR